METHTKRRGESIQSLTAGFQTAFPPLTRHSWCPAESPTLRTSTGYQCVFSRKSLVGGASPWWVSVNYSTRFGDWVIQVKSYSQPCGQVAQAQTIVSMKTFMWIRHWQTMDCGSNLIDGLVLSIKFYWDTAMLIHLCIIYGWVHATIQLCSCDRFYSSQTQK